VTGAVLPATSESGDVVDDPSEDALLMMFQDLEAGNGTFLIVESVADASGQTFVQAARSDDGTYVVEYRQAAPTSISRPASPAHVLVTMWAFGMPGLHERATWRRLEL
jgi:hypothetical protein